MHPNAAGIDVGNSAHYVAVRPDRDGESVRRFECFTADSHRMADWLQGCRVTTVAMQSTGVYWIPPFEILKQRGFQVYLVNARHTKNLPGRKNDVRETSISTRIVISFSLVLKAVNLVTMNALRRRTINWNNW